MIKSTPLSHYLFAGLLVSFSQSSLADNPAKKMMESAEKTIKSSEEAIKKGNEDIQKAINKAAEGVKAAAASLPSFKIVPATQNGEPEEPSKDFKWTPATIKLAEQGDVKRGEELAKKGKCSKCHGDTGISDEDDTPSIAGQITAYSFKQLYDFKVGLRKDKTMTKKVRELSLKDMADISAWYATQTREKMLGVAKGKKAPVLATVGDMKRYLLACNTCHNEDAMKRGYQIPILEGQKIEYFTDTLTAFKEGDRENDHYSLMRGLSAKLTEDEIDELAGYYSAKPSDDDD